MDQHVIIVGGGPCGLAVAIALKRKGLSVFVIEKGNVVQSIYQYPIHQQFFSSSHKLEIGDIPFIVPERKPKRLQALAYYRDVAKREQLDIHTFERVQYVEKQADRTFVVQTDKEEYHTPYVVIATGYYDHPNRMNIPGEHLEKVFHYFREAHSFFNQDVAVIGGKNSAVDATLELEKAGARVTVLYRGKDYSDKVKPWILPEFQSLIKNGKVKMEFKAKVKEIRKDCVIYKADGQEKVIANDFVFAMIGYHPDHSFLKRAGVNIEADTGRPVFNRETMETNVKGMFIAGVIAAGNEANEIFIENGRWHGEFIAGEITKRIAQKLAAQ